MNPDTSEFLDGYDRWYKNLPSPGGAAEMEKLKGGKMKETITNTENLKKKLLVLKQVLAAKDKDEKSQ
jgi:hypothetical protein